MIIDLTHTICNGMPVYPGTPAISMEPITSLKTEGFRELMLSITSHTGTHVDAPSHIFEIGDTIDTISLDSFIGNAVCLECPAGREIGPGTIGDVLSSFPDISYLVFDSGWHRYWGDPRYFEGFPVMEREAALLVAQSNLKGVCMDTISADSCENALLSNHNLLLANGKIIAENLTNTSCLPKDKAFKLYVIPLKVKEGDGSPARVFAIC